MANKMKTIINRVKKVNKNSYILFFNEADFLGRPLPFDGDNSEGEMIAAKLAFDFIKGDKLAKL